MTAMSEPGAAASTPRTTSGAMKQTFFLREATVAQAPEHSYEAIRTDIVHALANDGFSFLEAESLVVKFEAHVRRSADSGTDMEANREH